MQAKNKIQHLHRVDSLAQGNELSMSIMRTEGYCVAWLGLLTIRLAKVHEKLFNFLHYKVLDCNKTNIEVFDSFGVMSAQKCLQC